MHNRLRLSERGFHQEVLNNLNQLSPQNVSRNLCKLSLNVTSIANFGQPPVRSPNKNDRQIQFKSSRQTNSKKFSTPEETKE